MWILLRRYARPTLVIAAAIAVATCADAPTAPARDATVRRAADLAIAPAFTQGALHTASQLRAFGFTLDFLRVQLFRLNGATAFDTTIAVTPGDTLQLQLPVEITGLSEQLRAVVIFLDGQTVLFSGEAMVTASADPAAPAAAPISITTEYVGPGSNAAAIRITSRDSVISTAARPTFVAVVTDAAGNALADAPVRWSVSDTARATVDRNSGAFTPANRRGSVTLTAATLTGQSDALPITLVSPAADIALVSGGEQTGAAGRALATPFVVEVLAADGLPAAGEIVRFSAADGASITPSEVTTDEAGRASATATLARAIGVQAFAAEVRSIPAIAISASAVAGAPAAVIPAASDLQGTAGKPLAAPLVVRIVDEFELPVANAVVAWATSANDGVLSATTTTTAADGATSVGYTAGATAGSETITARAGASLTATFAVMVEADQPAQISTESGDAQSVASGSPLAPFVVRVTDRYGNPVPGVEVAWALVTGNGTLAASTSRTDGAGFTQVAYTAGTTAGEEQVSATIGGDIEVRFTIAVGAGPAARIEKLTGDATIVAGMPILPLPRVKVTDANGNGTAGSVDVTVTGPDLSSPTAFTLTTRSDGVAELPAGSLPNAHRAGTWTARVQLAGSSDPGVTFSFLIVPAAAAVLIADGPPDATFEAGTATRSGMQVRALDAFGNPAPDATVLVTVGAGHGSLGGAGSVTATGTPGGAVSVPAWTLPVVPGTYFLTAQLTVGGVAVGSPIVFSTTITAGPPARIVIASGDAQAVSPGAPLAPLVVRVIDQNDNPVSGVDVAWARTAGSGALAATTTRTDAQGLAQVTYTAGTAAGDERVRASVTGGFEVEFTVSVGAGPAARVEKLTGDATIVAGMPILPLPRVKVTDANGNGTSAPLDVTITGPELASPISFVLVAGGDGVAALPADSMPRPRRTGTWRTTVRLAGSSDAGVEFTFTVVPAPAFALSLAASAASTISGAVLVPAPAVQLLDSLGNVVAQPGVAVAASVTGDASLGGTTSIATDEVGIATFSDLTLIGPPGSVQLQFAAADLVPVDMAIALASGDAVALRFEPSVPTEPITVVAGVAPSTDLRLVAVNAAGAPVAGAAVRLTARAGSPEGPVVRDTLLATDDGGVITTADLAAATVAGLFHLSFSLEGAPAATPASLFVQVLPAAAAALIAESPLAATFEAGSTTRSGMVVRALDAFNNRVPGATVLVSVPEGGGSLAGAGNTIVTSGADGAATLPAWTLPTAPGTYALTAQLTAGGSLVGTPVTFTSTISTPAPVAATLAAVERAASPADTALGTATLAVLALDASGNPVPGQEVTWTIGGPVASRGATGPSGSAAAGADLTLGAFLPDTTATTSTTTGVDGRATVTFLLGTLAQPVSVSAAIGAALQADQVIDVRPASATQVTVGGVPEQLLVGDRFAPTAQLRDRHGNAAPAAGVDISVLMFARAVADESAGAAGDAPVSSSSAAVTPPDGECWLTSDGPVGACGVTTDDEGRGFFGAIIRAVTTPGAYVLRIGSADHTPVERTLSVLVGRADRLVLNMAETNEARTIEVGPGEVVTIEARVFDLASNPVVTAGQSVLWTQESTGPAGMLGAASTPVDGSGVAAVTFTTATTTSRHVITARHGGNSDVSVTSDTFVVVVPATATLLRPHAAANRTVGTPGESRVLAVEVRSADGIAPGARVSWSSLDGEFTFDSTATTADASGIARTTVTLGATAPRRHRVRAALAIAPDVTLDLRMVTVPAPGTKAWFGDEDDDWDKGGNWGGGDGLPPGLGDKVFVPGWADRAHPRLRNGARDVGDVEIEGGRGVGLALGNHELRVHGNLRAHSPVHGDAGAAVVMRGSGRQLRGTVAVPSVRVEGDVVLDGAASFAGALRVQNGGRFRLGGNSAEVDGNFDVDGSDAFLFSTVAGALLRVHGDVTVAAGYHGDKLTAGSLEIGGNFLQRNIHDSRNFQASGTHTTRLVGGGDQSITFEAPGDGASRFNHLEVAKPAGAVRLRGAQVIHGALTVASATPVSDSGGNVFVGGQVSAAPGSDLSGIDALVVTGAVNFPEFRGTPPGQLRLRGATTVASDESYPGSLTVENGGRLLLNGHVLDVSGDVTIAGSDAFLHSTTAASTLRVRGNLEVAAGYHGDKLTAGSLELHGSFHQRNIHDSRNFQASGSHTVRLVGDGDQAIVFEAPGDGSSRFNNLEVLKASGAVEFQSTQVINGTLSVSSATRVTASAGADVLVRREVTSAAGSDLAGVPTLTVTGTVNFPAFAGAPPGQMRLRGNTTVVAPTSHPGPITIENGGRLHLNGQPLDIAGDVTISGSDAFLYSTTAASVLTVRGNFRAAGGYHGDKLTAGTIELHGSFHQQNVHDSRNFQASGTHTMRLVGSGDQTVTFEAPGDGSSRFMNLEVAKPSGIVALATPQMIRGALHVASATTFAKPPGVALTVGHGVTTVAGSDLSGIDVLALTHDPIDFPVFAGAPAQALAIRADVTLAGAHAFGGNVSVQNGGRLRLNGQSLDVGGDLAIDGSDAFLYSTTAASALTVRGNFRAAGGYHGDKLTAGTLTLLGSFHQQNVHDSRNFQATGTHLTRFAGSGNQSVTFESPNASATSYGASGFAMVEVANTGAGVAFGSDAYAHGDVDVMESAKFTVASGKRLLVRNELRVRDNGNGNGGGGGSVTVGACRRKSTAVVNGSLSCPVVGSIP